MSNELIDYDKFKDVQRSLLNSFKIQKQNIYFNTSHLWQKYFSCRTETIDLSDFLLSLSTRNNFSNGIGELGSHLDNQLFLEYYKSYINLDSILESPMPWLGSPTVIDFDNIPVSAAYLSNLRLFNELKHMLNNLNITKPLRIVEIGAGYGGLAYFLLKSGYVQSYTIIDLPDNLKMSAFHLTQIFKDMSWYIPETLFPQFQGEATLNFIAPGNLECIQNWTFDLAINTDSIGEMPKETAQAYIRWIQEHLKTDGAFFTKNGHNRGKDCIQFPREYGYNLFKLCEIMPPTAISTLFDDFSHYILLKKQDNVIFNGEPYYLDVVCSLFALGLQDELIELCQSFGNNKFNEIQMNFLSVCHAFFSASNIKRKLEILDSVDFPDPYSQSLKYLRGISYYVLGQNKKAALILEKYLVNVRSYIAEAYALMIISKQNQNVLSSKHKFGSKTDYALGEIKKYYTLPFPLKEMALKLRKDILRKKINYPGNYVPSNLLKFKNLLFNIKEKKGWSTIRSA